MFSLSQAQFLHNPDGVGFHAHAPTIALGPHGERYVAWYAYAGSNDWQGARLMFLKWAKDLAAPGRANPLFPNIHSSVGNPVLWFDAEHSRLWLWFVIVKGNYWTDAVLHESYSDDCGVTWASPVVCSDQRGLMARHAPVRATGGELLFPLYDEKTFTSLLWRRDAHEWRAVAGFEMSHLIQGTIVRDHSGALTQYFRPTESPEVIWRSGSTSDGLTWSNPVQTVLPCPLSGIAAAVHGGAHVVVYNHSTQHRRWPLSCACSTDRGVTWSEPQTIDDPQFEVSYPALAVGAHGEVHCVYSFNRRMIKYVVLKGEGVS